MKTNKDKVITLNELLVSVDADGISKRLAKSPMKFTGKNYIPQRLTPELEAMGFDHGSSSIYGRVAPDQLMVVRACGLRESYKKLYFAIYFLEPDFEAAKKLIVKTIDAKLADIRKNFFAMNEAWINRKDRPRRK